MKGVIDNKEYTYICDITGAWFKYQLAKLYKDGSYDLKIRQASFTIPDKNCRWEEHVLRQSFHRKWMVEAIEMHHSIEIHNKQY